MRAVVLLLCLLAWCTAPSTAQDVDIPSETIHNPAAALKAAVAGLHAQLVATAAVSPAAAEDGTLPVRAPAVLSFQNGGSQDWDIESMVTGDVADAGTAAVVPGTSTAVGGGQQDTAGGRVDVAADNSAGLNPSSGSDSSISTSSKQKPADGTTQSSSKGSAAGGASKVNAQPTSASASSSSSSDAKGSHTGSKAGKGKVTHLARCPLWAPSATDQGLTSADRPAALSIFSELTVDEYNAVLSFLYSKEQLGLIDVVSSDPDRILTVANYIHSIHMEMPPKAEVLRYLDHHGPRPARRARAMLVLGGAEPPVVREVVVTLDDEGDALTVSSMKATHIHSSSLESIPYAQRPQGPLDENGVIAALDDASDTLNEVFGDAFDGFTFGEECGDKCIDWSLTYSQTFQHEGVARASYVQFYWYRQEAGDGNYLHPVPAQALIGATGPRLEEWSILRLWFAGRFFESPAQLAHAWQHDVKGLRSNFELEVPGAEDALFATFKKRPGHHRRGVEQPVGPLPWEPYGRRFTITHGNRVNWLGWSLYVGYLPHYGGRFWDIRFKGERMAYELSLQEAMAVYGSADLSQANTVFLDSSFGMGYNLRELAQGIDCPMNAAFMDADIFYSGMSGPTTYKNAICVFEHSPNMPLLRHYSSAYKFYGAVPGAQLIVRMISTVYNYDYIQDLVLGVDGTLDVKVTTSGYIQATAFRSFYPRHYGFPVFNNVSGTVHTHVLAWKVDLDIAGTQNSLNMLHFKSAKANNGLGGETYINRYDASIVETEEESAFVSKMFEPKMPVVINEQERNKWGSPRGYKIQLNRPLANLEPKGYPRSKGLGFWKWNFVATKRSEAETHSSSCFTQSDLSSPPTCLPNYVDGDSIRRKDLVVWVNSGLYHVPMAEDAPVTPASGHNQLGFSLIPYNWADENPAVDMADLFEVDLHTANTTTPAVKRVLHKCKPHYTKVPFATTGFDGVVHTDEDIAGLATVDLDADAGEGAVSSSAGSSKAHSSSKKSSVRKGHAKGSKQQAVPTAGAVLAPGKKPSRKGRRKCRDSKRWRAC